MRIEFNDSDSQVVLIGELTFNDHAAFREMLTRAMRSTGAKIVLDLSRLDFVDSAGLGMLLIARDEAGKGSRSLSLVRPQKQVERVFAVTKFETLFTVTRMDGSGAGRHPGISLWDGASEQSLARALRPPVVYCVEQGLREALLELGGLFHSLGLAVTTRAAFRLPVANAFVEAVDQRLQLDDDLRVRMLTVLHEAVINAVLHGNLGLGSSLRDNLAQMARLQRIIERRLARVRRAHGVRRGELDPGHAPSSGPRLRRGICEGCRFRHPGSGRPRAATLRTGSVHHRAAFPQRGVPQQRIGDRIGLMR